LDEEMTEFVLDKIHLENQEQTNEIKDAAKELRNRTIKEWNVDL